MCQNVEIRNRMKKLKVKQVRICEAIEVSEAWLSLVLSGQRKPSSGRLYRLIEEIERLEQQN